MSPPTSITTPSLLTRLRGAYAALRGRPGVQVTRPAISDYVPLMWAGRRMTPDDIRFALESAVGGNLQQQWSLFDLMEDSWPRLAKNLGELRRAASRTTYTVQPYAERGEEPSASAQARADTVEAALRNWRPTPGTLELSFEDALYDALDAVGKGLSVLEVAWQRTAEGVLPRCAHLLHPSHYGWNAAGTELGLVGVHGDSEGGRSSLAPATWQPFPPGQFWVGVRHARSGAPGQTALLRSLAPYWCGITFGWEWLLNNAQIFGVPFRWATYDPNRPDLLPTLTEMLTNLGQAGWAAFPQGTTMEFKEAVQRAADNPQVLIQAMADKACDLLILGQEASAESKPAGIGNGASDLHGAVRADRLQDAAQWCADVLNYQLVPAVLRWNFGDALEPPTIAPDFAGEPDPKAQAERDEILARIAPLPADWFYERHNIPQPVDGEATVGSSGAPSFPPELGPAGLRPGVHTAPGGAERSPETGPDGAPVKPASQEQAAAAGDVQATALNGAQVQALKDLAAQVATGDLPLATAQAIAEAAFPLIAPAVIAAIFAPLVSFKPSSEPAPTGPVGLPPHSAPRNAPDGQGGDRGAVQASTPGRINPRGSAGHPSRQPHAAGAEIPGAYTPPPSTTESLAAAHARDLAPLRQEAEPLLAAIQAGDLAVLGELEAFIARLDHLAPTIIGAGDLADALESALAEAAIAGAAGAYERLTHSA